MSGGFHDTAEIAARLAADVDGLVMRLLPQARRQGNFWIAGNVEGDKGKSLFIVRAGPRRGKWQDAATGEHGDMLDLIAVNLRLAPLEARDWARDYLGISISGDAPRPDPRETLRLKQERREREALRAKEVAAGDARRRRNALAIWSKAQPGPGTIVNAYLRSRGIILDKPPAEMGASLRYHDRCPHPSGAKLPAMVALVEHVEHGPVAIHRTFLRADGSGKAGAEPNKASLGPIDGGAIHFGEPSPDAWLVVAEGIETALSVAQITRGVAWSAISAIGLEKLILPDDVRAVLIAADNDSNGRGELAARNAAAKWIAEGRRVRIAMPPKVGMDFNDILIARRHAPIREGAGNEAVA